MKSFKQYVFPSIIILIVGAIAQAGLVVDPIKEGGATAALQSTGNASLSTIATNTTGVSTAALQSTQETTLSSILSAVTGVSTAANQVTQETTLTSILSAIGTGNTSLASIATNTAALAPRSSAVLTQVSNAVTSFSMVALNVSRGGLTFYNNSTTNCAIAYASSASMVAFTYMLQPGTHWEMPLPIYTGAVSAICTAATGVINSTEY